MPRKKKRYEEYNEAMYYITHSLKYNTIEEIYKDVAVLDKNLKKDNTSFTQIPLTEYSSVVMITDGEYKYLYFVDAEDITSSARIKDDDGKINIDKLYVNDEVEEGVLSDIFDSIEYLLGTKETVLALTPRAEKGALNLRKIYEKEAADNGFIISGEYATKNMNKIVEFSDSRR